MSRIERAAPAAAILSALTSFVCCLPLGFLAALGAAGGGVILASLRPWLLGLSAILLAVGFAQLYRGGRACAKRSVASVILLWTATVLVLALILFPEMVAGLLADLSTPGVK